MTNRKEPPLKIGGLTVRAMPATPMTNAELKAQCELVSSVAPIGDWYTEEEEALDERNKP